MRYDTSENIENFKKNSETKTIAEWCIFLGCERNTIERWRKRLGIKTKKPIKTPHSDEQKLKISLKRKEWLRNNPDKHPWRKSDKLKSQPCEKAKEFLTSLGISFIPEFQPEIEGRFFSVDIAIPDKLIALEINGNQHYERSGKLKPYYQERHNLLEMAGWTVFEIHYSACFDLKKWGDFVNQILNSPSKTDFDYFAYKPRPKISKKNTCACGGEKWKEALRCQKCCKDNARKKNGVPAQIPTENAHLEGGCDLRFHHGNEKRSGFNLCECGNQKQIKSKRCSDCWNNDNVGNWPSKEEMQKLVWEIPSTKLAARFNISDVALGKFCKANGIQKPPRGYWASLLKKLVA
jgi:hypothetical protein